MTVGDHLEENIFPVYRCQIKDLKGKLLTFFAVALSRITGDMFCPLTRVQLKHLFPKVKEIENMCVTDPVDYLIGSDEAGLQPIRGHKAKGGGEFYVWKNSFGQCIGGRHELIASAPEKNSAVMFNASATLSVSNLRCDSLQMPSGPTCSETRLQINPRSCEATEDGDEWSEEGALRQQVMKKVSEEEGQEFVRSRGTVDYLLHLERTNS